MSIVFGVAQDTPEEARGDPGETFHLTVPEKKELLDGLDDGSIDAIQCLREHGGGETQKNIVDDNKYYKHDKKKVMGMAREGILDDTGHLYLAAHLDYTHPDTHHINKVIDQYDPKTSRIGFSLGTDVVRRPKGPIIEKHVAHLGITEDPLYHDDGQTKIFFRGGAPRDYDNFLRENVLDKPGFYIPKNMERRLRDPDHVLRHTVGASAGVVNVSSANITGTSTASSESNLVTSPGTTHHAAADPVPVSRPNMSAPAPVVDAMDVVPPVQAAAPAVVPTAAPAAPAGQENPERARLSTEYQQILDKASAFVKTPDLADIKKKEAAENFIQAFDYKSKLTRLREQLGLHTDSLTLNESDVTDELTRVVMDLKPKLIEEMQNSELIPDSQKSMNILGIKTNPLLNAQQLVSVHANAQSVFNQRAEQAQLKADLAESRRATEAAQKESASFREQINTFNKRPRDDQPLPGASETPASLLKKTRTEEPTTMAPPPSQTGQKINGIELPQRFSVGASASTGTRVLQMNSVAGQREMPVPVSVSFRYDLGNYPPGMPSKMGLTMTPLGLSKTEAEHYAMLHEKHDLYASLALVHNDREHTLREPAAYGRR